MKALCNTSTRYMMDNYNADPATNSRVFFELLDDRDFYDQLLIDFKYYEDKLNKNLKGDK